MKKLLTIIILLITATSYGQTTYKVDPADSSRLIITQGTTKDTIRFKPDTINSTLYVLKAGSYDDPAWIDSLSVSKIKGLGTRVTSVSGSLPLRVSGTTAPVITLDTGYNAGLSAAASIGLLKKITDSLQANINEKVSSQWATVSSTELSYTATSPNVSLIATDNTAMRGLQFKTSVFIDAFIKHQPNTGEMRISSGRNSTWGGSISLVADSTEVGRIRKAGMALGTPTLDGSALLTMHSSTKGFLPPRMTAAQRLAISSPATGLVVFDTDSLGLMLRLSSSWVKLGTGSGGSTDTTSLSDRINLKLNIADTANKWMVKPAGTYTEGYIPKITEGVITWSADNSPDTTSLSNRINAKVNISDTSNMLDPYLTEPELPEVVFSSDDFYNPGTSAYPLRVKGKGDSTIQAAHTDSIAAHRIAIDALSGGGGSTWGSITGTLSSQTDLQTALDGKVDENSAITGATKTKITYDAKGLVTAGADLIESDIPTLSQSKITNLTTDLDAKVHAAGKAGGQSITGGLNAGDGLTFTSTSHGTKGNIDLGTFWRVNSSGNLLAQTDATYDIGASAASRPRDFYLSRTATIGGSSSNGKIDFKRADGTTMGSVGIAPNFGIDGSPGAVINLSGAHVRTSADNSWDFGASATRWRTGYFGTSIFSPTYIGGTSTTSTITYKTTTGVGATGADHIFQVGNNGATEALRILNDGAVGIGTASPNASALLDLTSTTKGLLLMRMTKAQRDAISSPADGLVIYQTDNNIGLKVRVSGAWHSINTTADP